MRHGGKHAAHSIRRPSEDFRRYPFREPCVAQVLGHAGTGLEGIEICFTLRGSAAATFPSPPSGDGITWFAAKMIPAPHPVDFTLTAG
ncbi:hypothetical protein ABIA39_006882 [Nocardia sp. GAS34]|uniref:hypothetical protein n=1 Tax=Nocardia sp. GAS34 TaxID=3156305 RepID=UPI003D215B41